MKASLLPIILSFLLASACSRSEQSDVVLLAQVGEHTLTLEDAHKDIPAHLFQSDSINAIIQYRDDWVRRQLILNEAERLNFSERESVKARLQRMREEFIIQAVQDFIIAEMQQEVTVTEEEARNYYQENKEKFVLDERYVRYRHLIAKTRSDAEKATNDLHYGRSWEEVAAKYSLYPDLKIRESERFWPASVAGGDIEMLNRYLQLIGPSEISPIHYSGGFYHFVQLLEEKPKGEHPDLDWLIEEIKHWLVLEKRKRAFNTYVKNLYLQGQANNEIKVFNILTE